MNNLVRIYKLEFKLQHRNIKFKHPVFSLNFNCSPQSQFLNFEINPPCQVLILVSGLILSFLRLQRRWRRGLLSNSYRVPGQARCPL